MYNSFEELERVRCLEIQETYKRLVDLVTSKYNEIEETQPKLVKLAKGFALNHGKDIDELCYSLPKDQMMVHIVDGKHYPHLGSATTLAVPVWALYLNKAAEALEILDEKQ